MKFYFLVASLLCFNFAVAQEEDEDYYYDAPSNRNVVEGGLNYWIPQGDFANKSPENAIGGDFTYLRQINFSRFFLGASYSSRRLDSEKIIEIAPDVDSQFKISNTNYGLAARFYPQVYYSILELFVDAGAGLHVVRSMTRDYDVLAEEYFNQNTIQLDRGFYMQVGGGIHIALDESWFLTAKGHTFFGPTVELMRRVEDPGPIEFPEQAFLVTNAAYRASTFSVSLTFIF